MGLKMLKWCRSKEGYTHTHCREFSIEPRYWGSYSPQGYDLIKHGINKVIASCDTQKECKQRASKYMQKVNIEEK